MPDIPSTYVILFSLRRFKFAMVPRDTIKHQKTTFHLMKIKINDAYTKVGSRQQVRKYIFQRANLEVYFFTTCGFKVKCQHKLQAFFLFTLL